MYSRIILRSIKHYHINPIIKVLIVSDFLIWSSYQLLAPVFAIFITDKITGGSIEAAGIAIALYLIFKSIFEMPVGMYIDRSKSEKDDLYTALVGTVLTALVFFMYPLVDAVWQVYVLQAIFGIASALAFPGWYSIFTRHVDKGKAGFEWSLYDVLTGIGMSAAAALGGFMAEEFGFGVVFITIGCFTLLGGLLLVVIRNKVYSK